MDGASSDKPTLTAAEMREKRRLKLLARAGKKDLLSQYPSEKKGEEEKPAGEEGTGSEKPSMTEDTNETTKEGEGDAKPLTAAELREKRRLKLLARAGKKDLMSQYPGDKKEEDAKDETSQTKTSNSNAESTVERNSEDKKPDEKIACSDIKAQSPTETDREMKDEKRPEAGSNKEPQESQNQEQQEEERDSRDEKEVSAFDINRMQRMVDRFQKREVLTRTVIAVVLAMYMALVQFEGQALVWFLILEVTMINHNEGIKRKWKTEIEEMLKRLESQRSRGNQDESESSGGSGDGSGLEQTMGKINNIMGVFALFRGIFDDSCSFLFVYIVTRVCITSYA